MTDLDIPTARDVIDHLNERFAARGLAYRIDAIDVLPYVSPMWLANWSVPQLDAAPERDIIDEEIAEARWKWPQVLDEQWEGNPPRAMGGAPPPHPHIPPSRQRLQPAVELELQQRRGESRHRFPQRLGGGIDVNPFV